MPSMWQIEMLGSWLQVTEEDRGAEGMAEHEAASVDNGALPRQGRWCALLVEIADETLDGSCWARGGADARVGVP